MLGLKVFVRIGCAGLVWLFFLSPVLAQDVPAPAAPELAAGLAQQAVEVVLSRYQIDPANVVPDTGEALDATGSWSVSMTPADYCPQASAPCVVVSYLVPAAQVSCEWTVLLGQDAGSALVLDENSDAGFYMMANQAGSLVPNLLFHPDPVYPDAAQADQVQGTVTMLVQVDATGVVKTVTVLGGPDELQGAAVGAVQAWTYDPVLVEGTAVAFRTVVRTNFVAPAA